jgi:hypothetical protein
VEAAGLGWPAIFEDPVSGWVELGGGSGRRLKQKWALVVAKFSGTAQ